jgi:3-hydroxyisobutyrate dehydrogenase-like beta-hydroxyacid dehydrogenase
MGSALVTRLLRAGADVSLFNRTRSKAEVLASEGATIVDSPADLADRDLVFTIVGGPEDVLEVCRGERGVLSRGDTHPSILVDITTIDPVTSQELRTAAADVGTQVLAAPVSGNPRVVASGKLTVVASGPRDAYETARPYLEHLGRKVTYVGDGDEARLVKICHNLFLGTIAQSMAEITVLAEAYGVSRADFLEVLNDSVLGSVFTRYKTPALVNLEFKPTFTWQLLRKDLELGLDAARRRGVPLPAAALVHQIVTEGIGLGFGEEDFAALLVKAANGAGRTLEAEGVPVDDGLT